MTLTLRGMSCLFTPEDSPAQFLDRINQEALLLNTQADALFGTHTHLCRACADVDNHCIDDMATLADAIGGAEHAQRFLNKKNRWLATRSLIRSAGHQLDKEQKRVQESKKKLEVSYLKISSLQSDGEVLLSDYTQLSQQMQQIQKKWSSRKSSLSGEDLYESTDEAVSSLQFKLDNKLGPSGEVLQEFIHQRLGDEEYLSGVIASIIHFEDRPKRSMDAIFGSSLTIEGDELVRISGLSLEEIFGTDTAKKDAFKEELTTLLPTLMENMHAAIASGGGDVSDEATKNAALQAVLETLKLNAHNKSDRNITRAHQALDTLHVTAGVTSASFRLAASMGLDPSAYLQLLIAVKKANKVAQECLSSLDKRKTRLDTTLTEIKQKKQQRHTLVETRRSQGNHGPRETRRRTGPCMSAR